MLHIHMNGECNTENPLKKPVKADTGGERYIPFWTAIIIFVFIFFVYILCDIGAVYLLDGSFFDTEAATAKGSLSSLISSQFKTARFIAGTLVFTLCSTVFLVLVTGVYGGFRPYMRLGWPGWKKLGWATGLAVLMLVFENLVCWLAGIDPITPWQREVFQSVTPYGAVLLFVVIVMCAPWWEELAFRGLLAPSFSRTVLAIPGAAVLSSLPWAFLHMQYEYGIILIIFVFGVILGVVRLRTGSLFLVIYIHAFINLAGYIETFLVIKRMLQ